MLYACCNTDSSSFLMCKAQTQYEWEEASKISDPERAICLQEDFNSCILNIYFGIRASHSLLSHCSPHMRQACCGSPCTLWSFSSLIKVVMMSLRCWLLLLVVRQSWFFGKYAVFVPEIWSGDPGNGKFKKKPVCFLFLQARVQQRKAPYHCTGPVCYLLRTGSPIYISSVRCIRRKVDSALRMQNRNPATRRVCYSCLFVPECFRL